MSRSDDEFPPDFLANVRARAGRDEPRKPKVVNNVEGLLSQGNSPKPAGDGFKELNDALTLAAIAAATSQIETQYHAEFIPQLRRSARAYVAFLIEAHRAGALLRVLATAAGTYGMRLPAAPEELTTAPPLAAIRVLARAMVDGNMIEATDSIFNCPELNGDL